MPRTVNMVTGPSRSADIEQGEARWDGFAVPLGKGGMFDKSKQFGGKVRALSLELTAVDTRLAQVFLGYGAIEIVERFKGGGMMSVGQFEDVPTSDWLTDATHDAPAIQRALGSPAAPPNP